ncbi:hypothetical protein NQ117_00725 [Paenibacillus sp. SC116]|uniref:hypothetical protein n=1 Tax=Paenibacillus sp. SC116 TaxID=2968986 RepID=UPI00215B1644|nr:hypothetical protein [Paenibacillus sp. SC116]MCR8842197.1 hypothetical protein [Paenibacillus sp. SC116]
MNNKKMVLGAGIILSILLLTSCDRSEQVVKPVQPDKPVTTAPLLPRESYGDQPHTQANEEQLYQFITKQLTGTYGVFTNFRNTDQSAEVATGHEVLSESAGLLMRYYALTGQQQAFDAEWNRAKQTFNLSEGFSYRYSPQHNKRYPLNAAVDDLRLIRALHEASIAFDNKRYSKEAEQYGKRFYDHNSRDGRLYDFYDETYKMTNDFITLCYIDLTSLGLLPISTSQEELLQRNMLDIMHKGYLSDQFPFYETRYSYKSETYQSERINTVESLLTILSLVEVKQHNPASITFIKEQVQAGTLFGQYTKEGKATTDIQSTAIYAIAAMIGSELGDEDLYKASIQRMEQYQVRNSGTKLDGGYGDAATQQAYSFDNLMALLAYAH